MPRRRTSAPGPSWPEELVHPLVTSADLSVLLLQHDKIVLGNRGLERLTGRRLRSLYALPAGGFLSLVHRDDRAKIRKHYEARTKGLPSEAPYLARVLHRAHGIRWVTVYSMPIAFRGEPAVQAVLIDVTQTRQTMAELHAHSAALEARVREGTEELEATATYMTTVFESSYDGIGIIDAEGRFEHGNSASFRVVGWPREELIGQFFLKVFPPEWHAFMIERWSEVQRGEGEGSYETEIITRDGDRRNLRISHRRMTINGKRKYAVIVSDITRLKQIQATLKDHGERLEQRVQERTAELTDAVRRLRLSEKALERAQQIAHVGSFEWDIGSGQWEWSREMYRLFGLDSRQGVLDTTTLDAICHPDDLDRVQDAVRQTLETGTALNVTYRLCPAGAPVRVVHARGSLRVESGDGGRHLSGTLQDITEQRLLEHRIVEASLREQQRIGADIHDSLSQEISALSLLVAALHKQAAACAPTLAAPAERISTLAQTTVRHARALAHGLAPVDIQLGGLDVELRRMTENESSVHKAAVRYRAAPGRVRIRNVEHATHLYYIAKEAVANALHHGKATQVEVRLSIRAREGRLKVRDNGTWMNPSEAGGSGLLIMRHRADLIGARLSIDPSGPRGTTITCTFPNGESRLPACPHDPPVAERKNMPPGRSKTGRQDRSRKGAQAGSSSKTRS